MPSEVILDVDVRLDKIDRQLKSVFSRPHEINAILSPTAVNKLRGQLDYVFNRSSIRLTNIDIAGSVSRGIKSGLQSSLNKTPLYINKVALGRGAAASLRASIQQAIGGITIGGGRNLGVGGPLGVGGTRGGGGNRGGGGGGLPLGRISGDVSEFSKSIDAAAARVTAFGGIAGSIYLVANAFKELVTSTLDVDKALREINVLLNLTDKDLSSFGGNLFDISRKTATGFDVVSKAALEFSRQGLSVNDTLAATQAALNLTRLSGLDSAKAVDALTTAYNSFNKEGLTRAEITDRLAAVDAVAATSAGGLAEGIGRVGSTAADAGVQFNQLLGLIAAGKQITGRSESVVGNALKTVFTRLERNKVRDVLGDVIDLQDSDGGVEVLQKIADKYDTLSRSQKSFIGESVAGVFQINQFKAIMSDLNNEVGVYNTSMKAAANSTGIADARVAELTKSTADLAQIAGTNLQQAFANIGKIGFAGPGRKFLSNFNDYGKEIGESFQNVESGQGTIGEKIGVSIGQGVIRGIASVITGPGGILLTTVAGAFLLKILSLSKANLKELLGTNRVIAEQGILEKQIISYLQKKPALQDAITSKQKTELGVMREIYNETLKLMRLDAERAKIAKNIASQGITKGLRAGNTDLGFGIVPKQSRFAKFKNSIGQPFKDPINLAFGASIAAESIASAIPTDTKGARGAGALVSGIGKIGSSAFIGSLFGPVGTAVGAAAGALFAVPDIVDAFTSNMADFDKAADKSAKAFTEFDALANSLLQLQSNYDDLADKVKDGTVSTVVLAQAQLKLAAEIVKLPDDLKEKYNKASDFAGKLAVIQEGRQRIGAQENIDAVTKSFNKIFEDLRGTSGSPTAAGFFDFIKNLPAIIGGATTGDFNVQDRIRERGIDAAEKGLNDFVKNLVSDSNLIPSQINDLANNMHDWNDLLKIFNQSQSSQLGELNDVLKKSPFIQGLILGEIQESAKNLNKINKDLKKAQEEAKDKPSFDQATATFDKLVASIKNFDNLMDLIVSNQFKNLGAENQFNSSVLKSRAGQASSLGYGRFGDDLNAQAGLQENVNNSTLQAAQIQSELFQTIRDSIKNGFGDVSKAEGIVGKSSEKVDIKYYLLDAINNIFAGEGSLSSKQKDVSKLLTDQYGVSEKARIEIEKLNESVSNLFDVNKEKLAQNQKELEQINKKLALDTLNANIDRLIKAAENAFGGISNFTKPGDNPLFKQLKESLGAITGGANFGDQQRGRFGALQALTGIAGQPFLSDTNPDLQKTVQAYTTQLEDQFSSLTRPKKNGKKGILQDVLDPQTIKELRDSIKEQGGLQNIAQTQIFKSLGVTSGGLFDKQIKKFQNGAIQSMPDQLLDALTKATPMAENDTTVAIIKQTEIIKPKLDTIIKLLGGQPTSAGLTSASVSTSPAVQSNSATVAKAISTPAVQPKGTSINEEQYQALRDYYDVSGLHRDQDYNQLASIPPEVMSKIQAGIDQYKHFSGLEEEDLDKSKIAQLIDTIPRTGSRVNQGLDYPSTYSGIISRQSASSLDPQLLQKQNQERELRRYNDVGYQRSLMAHEGAEGAYNTIRNAGGTPNPQLFKSMVDTLGRIEENTRLTDKQQAALDAINGININIPISVDVNQTDANTLAQTIQTLAIQAAKDLYGDRVQVLERKTNTIPPPPSAASK